MPAPRTSEAHDPARDRLEEFDALRVTRKLHEYSEPGDPDLITLTLPAPSTGFGAFVTVEIVLADVTVRRRPRNCCLVKIAMPWPPSDLLAVDRQAINVLDLSVVRGGTALRSARITMEKTSAALIVDADELASLSGETRISFASPSLLFLVGGAYPFRRYALGVDIGLRAGSGRTVMYLDHGSDIALRCRIDNSEYHSLAYTSQPGYVRKITFFRDRPWIKMRYLYGISDMGPVTDVGRPLFVAGISALAAGLTLSLVARGLEDLGAASFALALFPPFAQAIRAVSPAYRSADIARRGPAGRILAIAMLAYVPLLVLAAWLLVYGDAQPQTELARWVERLAYIVGSVLVAAGIVYALLVQQQIVPRHFCDNCAQWLIPRHQARLHLDSRKTLCRSCWTRDEVLRIETKAADV